MREDRRYCRKCLLKDLDAEMKAPDDIYAQRLQICGDCEKLNQGTCAACGCYVELRAAARKASCPHKKW